METSAQPKRLWPFLLVGLFLMLLFALAVKLLVLANPAVGPEDAARAEERTKAYEDLQKENAEKLGTFAWADKAKGKVQIPIDQAIALTIPELNGRPPAPAGPIAPAADASAVQPSPTPAANATPAN